VPYPVVIFIVRELLAGLGYVHQAGDRGRGGIGGLLHRDVTPRNVLLSSAGEVKLADFGLGPGCPRGTMTVAASALAGTPGYMSPSRRAASRSMASPICTRSGSCPGSSSQPSGCVCGRRGDVEATAFFHAIRAPKRKNVSTLRSLIGLVVLGTILYIGYKVSTGSSVKTAVSGPETIFDETVRLDEGEARSYSFTVSASRRIHVSLHASPKRVNVILMTASDLDEYKRARASSLGASTITYGQSVRRASSMPNKRTFCQLARIT